MRRNSHLHFHQMRWRDVALEPWLLSPQETARATSIHDAEEHGRFVATRQVLRQLSADYLSVAPESLEFSLGEHGKPYWKHPPAPFYFNYSHSGEYMLLAFSATQEVGVDIQHCTPRNSTALAKRFFYPEEATAVAENPELFYPLWVAKEASAKATGHGLAHHLDAENFLPLPEKGEWKKLSDTSICLLEAPEGYAAALAIQGQLT